MFDLTPPFEEAVRRNSDWGLNDAFELASRLSGLRDEFENVGGGVNWQPVGSEDDTVALVYSNAPLVIIDPSFAAEAREVLADVDVVVVPEMSDYGDNLFRFDRERADELLPYSADQIDLDFESFSAWDFEFETL